MKLYHWLYPGLRIKRWLLAFAGGLYLVTLGWALAIDAGLWVRIEAFMKRVLYAATGRFLPSSVLGWLLVAAGAGLSLASIYQLMRTVIDVLAPSAASNGGVADRVVVRRQLARGPRIVAIGGGTGLSVLLRGLKEYTSNVTAIVTVTDDGGSSGRLRGELGILPPGDIRNCLVALADTEPLMARLFQHRFTQGTLAGHSLGNLFISALAELLGDFEQAVYESSKVLAIRGQVFPSTLTPVTLVARMADGRVVRGETAISSDPAAIAQVWLDPPDPEALPAALRAIESADMIVLGPGSLFTSILPNLLIPGIRDAVARARAVKLLVVNAMTQPGETDGFTAADHARAIIQAAGPGLFQHVLVNTQEPPARLLQRYRDQGQEFVRPDREALRRMGLQVHAAPLIADDDLVRHDPRRLARALLRVLLACRPPVEAGRRFDFFLLGERLLREDTGREL
ncbi:MAG: YvcK family protein [Bacillota bacterium]|nr:MAG: YvcK family protein [Bacillota bacterium]